MRVEAAAEAATPAAFLNRRRRVTRAPEDEGGFISKMDDSL
jgi:hypothetical protein